MDNVAVATPFVVRVTLVGLIDDVKVVPGYNSESVTVPENPLNAVTVIVEVDDAPSTSHIDDGFSMSRNDPGSLVAIEFATTPPATVPVAAVTTIRSVLRWNRFAYDIVLAISASYQSLGAPLAYG